MADLEAGRLQEAIREADQGLAHAASEVWHWKFYIRRAEAVSRLQGPRASLLLLQREPPSGPAFAEVRANRELAQVAAYYALSDYNRANALLGGATLQSDSRGSKTLLATIALWRFIVQSRTGDWTGAEQSIRDASRLARESNELRLQSRVLTNLVFLLMQQSRFEEAVYAVEQVLPSLERSQESARLARTLTNLGWCYYKLGEFDKALQAMQKAEAINRAIGDQGEQQIGLGSIAAVYYTRQDLDTAKQYYQRALKLASQRGDQYYSAKWLSNLAIISLESQDWADAEKYNNAALEIQRKIPDKTGELHSLQNAARIAQGNGRNEEAERIFQQVIHSDSPDPAPVLDAEAGLASLYASSDRPEKAEAQFRAALTLVDRSRSRLIKDDYKLAYLASLIEFYQSYVDWLMSRGKTEQALQVAEASRARILSERTGVNRATQTSSPARYKELARASGSVFLSYWTGRKRSFVWAITPRQIVAFPLPPESRIKSLVERYRALIENLQNPLDSDDPTGRELYEALLAPVREFIPEGGLVSVVPDSSLYALNFETLPVSGPKPHYWIEDAVVSVAPSLNLLAGIAGDSSAAKDLLLIGNPDSVDPQFPRLPYAGEEMELVRRHFDSSRVTALEGRNAVPASYTGSRPDRFSYVHFTAHATANRESPLDSAIILSGSKDRYQLRARDVLKQPLHADLVTISACSSAGAKTYAGEGLVGFTWTFFQSGAHNVIAGLWDVSDESTPRIMDHLYTGISGGQPIAGALRAAKLAVMNENQVFRLPYYWGALQLFCRDRLQKGRNVPAMPIASN